MSVEDRETIGGFAFVWTKERVGCDNNALVGRCCEYEFSGWLIVISSMGVIEWHHYGWCCARHTYRDGVGYIQFYAGMPSAGTSQRQNLQCPSALILAGLNKASRVRIANFAVARESTSYGSRADEFAENFVRTHGGDAGLMRAWFDAAIATGYDKASQRAPVPATEPCTRLQEVNDE